MLKTLPMKFGGSMTRKFSIGIQSTNLTQKKWYSSWNGMRRVTKTIITNAQDWNRRPNTREITLKTWPMKCGGIMTRDFSQGGQIIIRTNIMDWKRKHNERPIMLKIWDVNFRRNGTHRGLDLVEPSCESWCACVHAKEFRCCCVTIRWSLLTLCLLVVSTASRGTENC